MRLLFAHDHRFFRGDNGKFHTLGSFPSVVWDRYLRHFDSVHVLARDNGPLPAVASLATTNHENVRIDFAPNLGTVMSVVRRSPATSAFFEKAVREADAVIGRLPSEIGMMAVETAHRLGKPYAVEIVGCAWDSYSNHGTLAARLYAPLVYWRMKRAARRAPLALYVTSQWLQDRYPTRNFWSSASNVEIVPLDEEARARREARVAELAEGRVPQLGTIASLMLMTKGVQTAISALAMLRREGIELPYAVLGPGDPAPWRAMAEREGVAHLVSFDGTREAGAGVRRWLDGIDIHIQPSFQEGLPRGTIEAMSRGVACIGSTCGGLPELLSPDRTHRPGDVAGLAACIRKLATDPGRIAATSRIDLDTAAGYHPDILRERRDRLYGRLRALAEKQKEGKK